MIARQRGVSHGRFVVIQFKRGLMLLVCAIIFSGQAHARERGTRTMTLDNGIDVLMVSDSEVDRSAAALSVGTGHLYDPKEKAGLAHYLEHMLFLGTKRFPKVGSFKEYLNQNSGSSNAYTSSVVTNYFFQVSHEGFNGALERFSDFFKAPLFDPKYAKREVNAVSSEHDKNKQSDGWRGSRVISLISEPGHPLQHFGTGNKDTLAGNNRPHLLKFYKKYYSASNMKLAIISNLPFRDMEDLAQKYFSSIPRYLVEFPDISPNFRKPLKDKYRLLKIKTLKDIRTLSMEFPTIRLKELQINKPSSIIGSVIGYEGKGSLLSELKREGLALGLSAGGGYGHPNINEFSITVTLTEKGVKKYERVMELVFSYIEMLRKHKIQEYTFKENQMMAQIDFDYKSPAEGAGFVSGKAAVMQNYPLKSVETAPYLYGVFDPESYKRILDTLTPENMLAILKTNSVGTDQTEKYYDAEYSITEVGSDSFNLLSRPSVVTKMTYPEKNGFIPYHLKMNDEDPHIVRDDSLAKVWFKHDHRFDQPKVYMNLRIQTSKVYDTADSYSRSKLYDAALREGLNEEVYPIKEAGLSYSVGLEKEGIIFNVGGYSERIADLVKLVARNLTSVRIDQQKFNNLKDAIIRGLKNRRLGKAYGRGGYFHRLIWIKKEYTEEEILSAIEKVTLTDIREYAKSIYEKVFITGVAHGNWRDEDVLHSINILLKEIKSKPLPKKERYQELIEVLSPGKEIRFSQKILDNNNSLAYTLQAGEFTLKNQGLMSFVASIVGPDFYLQMRTNQQLGYIVWSFSQRLENRLFMRFVIQSATHGPFELKHRIEGWMKDSIKIFDKLSDEEFERHRKSLLVGLLKETDSIREEAGRLYYLATKENGNFQMKKKLAEVIKKITRKEVISTGKKLLLDPITPRVIVHMRAKGNEDPIPAGTFSKIRDIKNGL